MICQPEGPVPAKIMIVGEAPGYEEERTGRPFQGASGQELNRMLHEANIMRSECFITNVCRQRPANNDISNFIAQTKKEISHEHFEYKGKWVKKPVLDGCKLLDKEIQMVMPKVIIALGNTPLWAITGLSGIQRWRGSMLNLGDISVIPTYHPAAVLRQWEWRSTTVHDLRRAGQLRNGASKAVPANYHIRPSYVSVIQTFDMLQRRMDNGEQLRLSFDLETRAGHIDCAGIAWTQSDALCVPFMSPTDSMGYWTRDEEGDIVYGLFKVLTHRNVLVVGQNLLYDSQYTYRRWCFVPRVSQDTMISWHVAFPGLPKKLDYQASLLCRHYVQWKKERGQWKEGG